MPDIKMTDTEEEAAGDLKREAGVEVASAHNNPPNQSEEGGEVQMGSAGKPQEER